MLWGHMSIWGHLGTLGSKGHFHYKCYNLSMLHSMTIRLIQVDQFETLYLCYGVICQSGVIWGHWGQKVIFTINAITRPCYIAWPWDSYRLISLRPSTYVMGSYVNLGSFGDTGSKGHFHYKCYKLSMLHSMTIRLIQVDQFETLYLCYGVICQSGVIWGHWDQKVIFTINAITCPCYIAWP